MRAPARSTRTYTLVPYTTLFRSSESVLTKDGPHVWEDHFLPETIDGDTGEPVADGALGELVFTSLTKEAFPVIRYRTRDLTRLLPGTAYPAMRRIETITGRNRSEARRVGQECGRTC